MAIIFEPADNDNDLEDYGPFELALPDPLACADGRRVARREGRPHPSHSSCAVERDELPAAGVHPLTTFSVESQPAPCMLFTGRRQSRFGGLSVKTRRMVSGTGPHELAAWKDLETGSRWIDFDMQTARVAWNSCGVATSYTSDVVALDEAGVIYVREMKADASYFLPPDYASVMEHAASGLALAGTRFEMMSGPTLRGSRRKRLNVDRAFGDRFTKVSQSAREHVAALLARTAVSLGEVEEILDADPLLARAKAHALLCDRTIAFSLDGVVSRNIEVTAPKLPAFYPDIRSITYNNDN